MAQTGVYLQKINICCAAALPSFSFHEKRKAAQVFARQQIA